MKEFGAGLSALLVTCCLHLQAAAGDKAQPPTDTKTFSFTVYDKRTIRSNPTTQIAIRLSQWPGQKFLLWMPESVSDICPEPQPGIVPQDFVPIGGGLVWRLLWAQWQPEVAHQDFAPLEGGGLVWRFAKRDDCRIETRLIPQKSALLLEARVRNTGDKDLQDVAAQNCLHLSEAPDFACRDFTRIYIRTGGRWRSLADLGTNNNCPMFYRPGFLESGRRDSWGGKFKKHNQKARADHPLIICVSKDGKRAVATASEDYQCVFHNHSIQYLLCIHSEQAPVPRLKPGREFTFRQMIYFVDGGFPEAVDAFNKSPLSTGPAGDCSTAAPEASKPARDYLHARPADMQWWRDSRFGLFVCWGPVSLMGTEIGWSRGGQRRGTGGGTGSIPVEVYDNLYKKWKPDKFDARQWVQLAQDAGAGYMIFLVKHHDGFCLYDTRLTDYKSTSPEAAWPHDVMADIAAACHQAGLKLFVYYSQPDWHHPDYRTENHHRYIQYLHGQIRELLTGYGRIDGLWFDGLGGKAKDWDAETLFRMIRRIQPHVIINNRCGLPGDFDTPEQQIGKFQTDRQWESCITLGTQWSWKPNDDIKSLKQCIDILVRCAGGDGNLALNTNPMPTGQIEPRQAARFREIGAWLKKYGKSIYATRGGPFQPGPWGASTHKDNTVYVHVLDWTADTITLPPVQKRIAAHSVLTGGKAMVNQTDKGVEISVTQAHRHEIDTIVVLELAGR